NRRSGSRASEAAAPAIMTEGPLSPPIASIAILGAPSTNPVSPPVTAGSVLRLGLQDFTPLVVAAARAHVVRQLQLAAIGAFLILGRGQRVVAAPHVAPRGRCLSLGDGHGGTCSVGHEF